MEEIVSNVLHYGVFFDRVKKYGLSIRGVDMVKRANRVKGCRKSLNKPSWSAFCEGEEHIGRE